MNSAIYGQNRSLVPVPNRGGTGTTLQNRFSTGTKVSGTSTTSSCNPGFGIFALSSYNSHIESIRTLRND